MYLGHLVEVADSHNLYENPRHPYTAALLSAVPKGLHARGRGRVVLQGDPPSPANPPSGCPFHPRCPKARQISGRDDLVPDNCRTEMPPLADVDGSGSKAACWYPVEPGDPLHVAAHA